MCVGHWSDVTLENTIYNKRAHSIAATEGLDRTKNVLRTPHMHVYVCVLVIDRSY